MKKQDFYFELPERLIAQHPLEHREESRLLVLNKKNGEIDHRKFKDILSYFKEGDCLVLNNTRVIPARLYGKRKNTMGKVEFLLLEEKEKDIWETLVKPGRKAKIGDEIDFGDGRLTAEVLKIEEGGTRLVKFKYKGILREILQEIGETPLPPYIKEKLDNGERYQTVYSKVEGSAAAPTAGLHFTKELLDAIKKKGVKIAYITLHVGLGTFRPVKVEDIKEHKMHSEFYSVSRETAEIINDTKRQGGRVFSVGTTSTRTLESVADGNGVIYPKKGCTDIFIYPGYKFKAIDGLITNFHLPESTLVMLVSAFSSRDMILNAYNEAIDEEYRFFSFGDAMLII